MRELDLQRALTRLRTTSEYLQNEAGAVDDLGAPRLLQIALLHRRQRAVHHNDADLVGFDEAAKLFDLALADIGRRTNIRDRHNPGRDYGKIDGLRKPDCFIELGLR